MLDPERLIDAEHGVEHLIREDLWAVWQSHVSCVAKVQGKGDKVQQSPNQIKPYPTVVSHDVPTTGMAIIDTGASRSVIDHVPAVLRKLPASIRRMVREQSSNIGFRFGNNQVLHSFKHLQIPLIHGRQRIWLLVEAVPRATPPCLRPIKAMKSFVANIDLSTTHAISRIFNVHSHSRKTTLVCVWLISPICVVSQLGHMKQLLPRQDPRFQCHPVFI